MKWPTCNIKQIKILSTNGLRVRDISDYIDHLILSKDKSSSKGRIYFVQRGGYVAHCKIDLLTWNRNKIWYKFKQIKLELCKGRE